MRRRGFTLLESLIVGAILVFVLGVVAQSLTTGFRVWTRSRIRAEVQQSAMVVAARIVKDYHNANPDSVAVVSAEATVEGRLVRCDGITFLTSLDQDGRPTFDEGGAPLWQRRLVIYHAGASQEVRIQEMPLDPPSTAPEPLQLAHIEPVPTDRVISRDVRALVLDPGPLPLLRLRVEAARAEVVSAIDTTSLPVLTSGTSPDETRASSAPASASPAPLP